MLRYLRRVIRRSFIKMPQTEARDQYSIWVGLIYIFNLIVGTGALTLPAAFAKAGWGLGSGIIMFLAFMSYMNATYVLETMACANAILKWRRLRSLKRDSIEDEGEFSNDEQTASEGDQPLVGLTQTSRYYNLDSRVELGQMANIFFNKIGRTFFYITISIYLYGDLSIYSAVVAGSIRDIICSPIDDNATDTDTMPCFNHTSVLTEDPFTRYHCYRIALLTFVSMLGPFVFFNVQKTKYLQLFSTLMRWMAFTIMISMAVHLLIMQGAHGKPPTFNITGMPTLFGTCVYSFMCHHSLPGLISPIRTKKHIYWHIALTFLIITMFYLLLAFTGAFAFPNLNTIYTLNFVPKDNVVVFLEIIEYYLALFPVFTLCTSFPIIAITLRNNLQSLFLDMNRFESYNFVLRRLFFPIVTVCPPTLLTLFVEDVTKLVEYTGSYAGTCIQYIIPTFLVLSARRYCSDLLGFGVSNPYKSIFSHIIWAGFVLVWSAMCVILVSVNFFEKKS